MNDKITFSVLVTAYNVEKYIERCIESTLAQTFQDFELVIVDDGSTDKTETICREYARKYSKITFIRQENRGAVYARRVCIQQGVGKYYVFLDSDDYLEQNALETIQATFEKYSCDCVAYGYKSYVEFEKRFEEKREKIDALLPLISNDRKTIVYHFLMSGIFEPLWRKAVRAEILPKETDYSSYYHISRANDLLQSLEAFKNINSVAFIDVKLYVYVRHNDSLTLSFNINRMMHLIEVFNVTYDFIQSDVISLFTPSELSEIIRQRVLIPFFLQILFVCCSKNNVTDKKIVLERMYQSECFVKVGREYLKQKKQLALHHQLRMFLFSRKAYRTLILFDNIFSCISKIRNSLFPH